MTDHSDHSWSWKRTINCPHKREFHEGMVFNGGAGLKKTHKGLDVLWNWNKGAGRVTTLRLKEQGEGACGHSLSGALI